jgi:hypothetical protein
MAGTSGAAMFTAIALATTASPAAPWKLGLIGVAEVNTAVFHTGVYRTVEEWDLHAAAPVRAQAAALVSALAWRGVIIAGRLLAYWRGRSLPRNASACPSRISLPS